MLLRAITLSFRSLFPVVSIAVLCLGPSGAAVAQTLEKSLEAYDFEEYQDAAEWLRPHAEKGHAEAQYRMGKMYEGGKGVERSVAEARRWYQKAAAQGHVGARRRLEFMDGKPARANDDSVALKWYQDKADAGDPDAQFNLGFMYETGFSVPRDNGRAAQWYELAAEKRNEKAQLRLGLMYLAGAGVKQSEIQAARWLGSAAERGNTLAKAVMEQLLEKNAQLALDKPALAERIRNVSTKDENRGIATLTVLVQEARAKFEREQAEHERATAKRKSIESAMEQQANVEIGLDAEGRRTVLWYKHNAERGSAMAQFQLGKFYQSGRDVPMDLDEAARWIGAAAQQGYPDAQFYLGMMNLYGIGVPHDPVLGESLIRAAAQQDHAAARRALSQLNADPSLAHYSAAAWWLLRNETELTGSSIQHAGNLYQQGRGVPMDAVYGQSLVHKGLELRSRGDGRGAAADIAEAARDMEEPTAERPVRASRSRATRPSDEVADDEASEPTPLWMRLTIFAAIAAVPMAVIGWMSKNGKKRRPASARVAPQKQPPQPSPAKPAPRARRAENPFK